MLYAFKRNWSNQIVIDMVLPCIYCIIGCSRNKYNLCCESLPLNQKYRHSELTNFIIQTKGQRKDTKNKIFSKKLSKNFVEKLMCFCIMYTKKQQDFSSYCFCKYLIKSFVLSFYFICEYLPVVNSAHE